MSDVCQTDCRFFLSFLPFRVMCHAALKPPIVTAADMSDIALPAPESVWTSPVHDYDEQLEEQRWSRAKQMSGAQFFAWKDERGTLQKMAVGCLSRTGSRLDVC